MRTLNKCLVANVTTKWLLACMNAFMVIQGRIVLKRLAAQATAERPLASVRTSVAGQIRRIICAVITPVAQVFPFSADVPVARADMLIQMTLTATLEAAPFTPVRPIT